MAVTTSTLLALTNYSSVRIAANVAIGRVDVRKVRGQKRFG